MKLVLFLISLSITLCMSELSDSAPGNLYRDPVIGDMIKTIDAANIEADTYQLIEMLQRISTREYGTAGNEEAANFIYGELTRIPGLSVEYANGDFRNIIGTLPGTDGSSKEIFMIGAHYDSTSIDRAHAPGATDNAGGVAAVLELARTMSQYQFNHTIKFAFWNQEEYGQGGSKAYAKSAAINSTNIPLYFNLDSACYDPKNRSVLDIMYDDQSAWAADLMTQANSAHGINFTLTHNKHTCTSDHLSFRLNGYPAIMTHSETHGPGNTPNDTVDKVSIAYLIKNAKLAMILISQLAEVH